MTDATLNRFVASGTAAERAAFTPTPPTPPSGPDSGYFWFETDTGDTYSWKEATSSWVQVNSSGAAVLADGDYGDIVVSGGGSVFSIDAGASAGLLDGDYQLILPIYNSTTLSVLGCVATGGGTVARSYATTNAFTKRKRVGVTVAATNTFGQVRNDASSVTCGVGDGWRYRARFGVQTSVASGRLLAGLQANWSGAQDPSATTGALIIVGKDSADTNLQIIHNDASGSAVKVNLGASFPANTSAADIYEVEFSSDVGATSISYRVTNMLTGAEATGTLSSDIPAAGTAATAGVWPGTAGTGGQSLDFFGLEYSQTYAY